MLLAPMLFGRRFIGELHFAFVALENFLNDGTTRCCGVLGRVSLSASETSVKVVYCCHSLDLREKSTRRPAVENTAEQFGRLRRKVVKAAPARL